MFTWRLKMSCQVILFVTKKIHETRNPVEPNCAKIEKELSNLAIIWSREIQACNKSWTWEEFTRPIGAIILHYIVKHLKNTATNFRSSSDILWVPLKGIWKRRKTMTYFMRLHNFEIWKYFWGHEQLMMY